MRYVAGDIFQVVSPRAADGDTFVQRDRTGMEELSGGISDAIVMLRAQPAILYYRVRSSIANGDRPTRGTAGGPLKSKVEIAGIPHLHLWRVQ
jgi:hypothetical protein